MFIELHQKLCYAILSNNYGNFSEKTNVVFPTLNINVSPDIFWNVAAGFSLNGNSDNFLFKSVLIPGVVFLLWLY
jgi:hypothetical protein